MATTIRDIAKVCSVSTSTVSGVLHNRDHVKKETRERILTAMKKLNYDPLVNIPLARRQKTGKIGLILPFDEVGTDPFYQRAVTALKRTTTERGFDCVIYSQNDIIRKTGSTYHLGRSNFDCDALIMHCPIGNWEKWLRTLSAWEIPAALIRRTTARAGIISIKNDDEQGIRLALQHLHAKGHKRIALLCRHRHHSFMEAHVATYKSFMEEHGLPFHEELMGGVFDNPAAASSAREIVSEWWQELTDKNLLPTACICRNDPLAMRLIMRLERMGVRVPEDVSVIGFDDDFGDAGMPLPLSTIRIPVEEMVTVAVGMLADKIKGINTGSATVDMPLELKIRESSL